MASITKTTEGTYRVRVRRIGGRPASATFRTKAEAEAWGAKVENDIHHRVHRDFRVAERTTVKELLTRYESEVAKGMKSGSMLHYHIARFVTDLGHLRLTGLTPEELIRWRDERLKYVKSGTVRRELQTLSSIVTWVQKDLQIPIPENPVRAIRLPPAGKARDRRLEDGEEDRLMAALVDHAAPTKGKKREGNYRVGTRNPWVKPAVQFAIETAMRLSEFSLLLWGNVDLEKQTAYLPDTKNGEARTVPLSTRAIAILKSLPRVEGELRVFPTTKSALQQAWRRARARAKIENLRLHDQRHEATSRLAEKLPNLIELAAVTGHKDLRQLKRYYHPRAEDLAKKLG